MSIHRQTVASPNVVGLKMCWRTLISINIEIKVSASYSDVSIVNHHLQSAMQSQLPCLQIIVDVTLLTRWQNIKSTSAHWCKIWKSNQHAGDKYIDPPLSATDGDVRFVPKYEIYANHPKILKILRRPLQKPRVYHCSVGGRTVMVDGVNVAQQYWFARHHEPCLLPSRETGKSEKIALKIYALVFLTGYYDHRVWNW